MPTHLVRYRPIEATHLCKTDHIIDSPSLSKSFLHTSQLYDYVHTILPLARGFMDYARISNCFKRQMICLCIVVARC